jgi:hypothetical protein
MTRIVLIALGAVLLLTKPSAAQSYCAQVIQAVQTYGYQAAKRHAMAHYSPQQVAVGERCLHRHTPTRPRYAELGERHRHGHKHVRRR